MHSSNEQGLPKPLLLELLVAGGRLPETDIDKVIQLQAKENHGLEETLVEARMVSEEDIASTYAAHLQLPILSPLATAFVADEALAGLLPEKFARDNRVLPLRKENGTLHVAMVDPSDLMLLQQIQLFTGLSVVPNVARMSEMDDALDMLFGMRDMVREIVHESSSSGPAAEEAEGNDEVLDLDQPIKTGKDTQIVRLVNHIFQGAIEERASDIHLEPYEEEVKIRLRIDGKLQEITPPPKPLFLPLLSRLKILAKMDIAEKRLAQDGAISLKLGDNRIDVRVSTVPIVHGEKMVLRILNKQTIPLQLQKLGFNERQCADFLAAAEAPHGLMFVTGPTGSGKSTTLYATLSMIKSPTKNIMTVEDPVEYKFAGINQVQVKSAIGLTFASVLRSFLRQDPDVIMVGEVRDQETAEICLRAALTGHLVLSTLHTNDAISAIPRLQDMGMQAFLIASALRLVEAQRLVRRLCADCKEPYQPDEKTIETHRLPRDITLYRPKGCAGCNDSGYRGRLGIFEVIRVTADMRELIQTAAPLSKYHEVARREGMQTLVDNGLEKVRDGLTSLEEILSVTLEGGE